MLKGRVAPVLMSLAFLASGVAVVAPSAYADSQARIVRLTFTSGDVQVDREGVEFERALRNMPITEGMRIWAGSDSRAEIEFEDASGVRLVDNSMVEFVELRLRDDAVRLNHVLVEQGMAYFDVKRKDAQDFRVSFGNRQIYLQRDARFRVHVQEQHASLAVLRGEVKMIGPRGELVEVERGETLTLTADDADGYVLAQGITASPFDDWAEGRRKAREQEIEIARRNSSVPVYAADLHHHGGYFHHAHYGRLWRPHGIGYDWHPYAHGAWVWYPHHGYVWVSAYSWGWAPYRWGTWLFVNNYGWCWRPALSFGFVWHRSPRYLYAPRWYRAPRAPRTVINTTIIVGVPRGGRRWGGGFDRDDWRRDRRRDFQRDQSVARAWRDRRERNGYLVRTSDGGGVTRADGRGRIAGNDGARPGLRGNDAARQGFGERRNGRPAVNGAVGNDTAVSTAERGRWSGRANSDRPVPSGETGLGRDGSDAVRGNGESPSAPAAQDGWRRNPMPRNNGQSAPEADSDGVARGRGDGARSDRPRPIPNGSTGRGEGWRSRGTEQPGSEPGAVGRGRPTPDSSIGGTPSQGPSRTAPAPRQESRPSPPASQGSRPTPSREAAPARESSPPARSAPSPSPAPRQEAPPQRSEPASRPASAAPTRSFAPSPSRDERPSPARGFVGRESRPEPRSFAGTRESRPSPAPRDQMRSEPVRSFAPSARGEMGAAPQRSAPAPRGEMRTAPQRSAPPGRSEMRSSPQRSAPSAVRSAPSQSRSMSSGSRGGGGSQPRSSRGDGSPRGGGRPRSN